MRLLSTQGGQVSTMPRNDSLTRCIIVVFVLFALILDMSSSVIAENNKFGIHVTVPTDEDLASAAALVNGDTGAYGYVALVIQENNKDVHYWQQIFDKLRELKLIPLVRLATQPEGENWRAPNASDAKSWADFLGKLNWVTKARYVMLFNEPNHAAEWGGNVDPAQYGKVAAEFAYELKKQSPDYIVMLAGLDLAAPESRPIYADAYMFLQESLNEFCKYFTDKKVSCRDYIDAVASHSYPNPGFAGSPYDYGRTSIRGYEFEIQWFENLLQKTLPVYITETGWDAQRIGQDTAASYFATAFADVWSPDARVKAVTPFLLNYQGEPFLQFSFFTQGEKPQPYPKYTRMQSIPKKVGTPDIVDTAQMSADIPAQVVEGSQYEIPVIVRNTGQAIWDKSEYRVSVRKSDTPDFQLFAESVTLPKVKPRDETFVALKVKTGTSNIVKTGKVAVVLERGVETISTTLPTEVRMELRPSIELKLTLLSKGLSTGNDFEVQIFDSTERLVYKNSPVAVTLGVARVKDISNIIPGRKYRVVVLKPYYLPRQVISTMKVGENSLTFEPMLPFDFDRDGKFSVGDLKGLLIKNTEKDKGFFEKMQLLLP